MDAKNDESESQEQHDLREIELPASLVDAISNLAYTQALTNELLMQVIKQQQYVMERLLLDASDDAEPREDMEGRPIRDS